MRREALCIRVEVRDLHRLPCRSREVELGSPIRVTPGRVASGPYKAGTCQHCRQMTRVRRVGWKGVRKEPAFTSLKARTGSNLVDMGRERCAPVRDGRGTPGLVFNDWPGGHGEVLRGSRGDAAGTESGSS